MNFEENKKKKEANKEIFVLEKKIKKKKNICQSRHHSTYEYIGGQQRYNLS